jgi:cytochrome c oxidase subunit II
MLESFYLTGWGGFGMMLFMLIPFMAVFFYIVYRKSVTDPSPSQAPRATFVKFERAWIALIIVVFVGVNIASIDFMPTTATARALASGEKLTEVNFSAESWSYDIDEVKIEVGKPVRFSGKSLDTMHGFAVYHPEGKVLFTMMLMPGMENPTSLVHTFKDPGTYTVRCLEYCGASHHEMRDEITVVAAGS